jgi:hypothetical protein
MMSGGVSGGVRAILRLEGLALLGAAILFYAQTDASWKLFALLFLAPDLSFAFYVLGARAGAVAYNTMHSTIGPILLGLAAETSRADTRLLMPIALIWLAHVGFDRALGYGLKYASGFPDTHLGLIGKARHQFA